MTDAAGGSDPPAPPHAVVCVLGQTGAGKTRLAVDIALEIGGEVVNCDAMQVYAGLPIATAQASAEEMRGVPHHMLGCVDPTGGGASDTVAGGDRAPGSLAGAITVRDFRDAALGVVANVIARGKTPVLVGGSDYYLRAVVSQSLLDEGEDARAVESSDDDEDDADDATTRPTKKPGDRSTGDSSAGPNDAWDEAAALVAHARLREVDPISAAKIHPRNTRRVRRYLEIRDATGEPASEIFARRRRAGAAADAMRFRSLFLCMRATNDELDLALRRRVDAMLAAGLVEELEAFAAKAANVASDDARGASQSIGFHEWGRYLRARGFDWTSAMPGKEGDTASSMCEDVDALRAEAVEAMKADTCRLARRQLRRCRRLERAFGWRITYLDSTAMHAGLRVGDDAAARSAWAKDVREPALAATVSFLAGEDPGSGGAAPSEEEPWTERRCEACDKTLRGETEWRSHIEGKRHRNRIAALRKKREGKHGIRQQASAES